MRSRGHAWNLNKTEALSGKARDHKGTARKTVRSIDQEEGKTKKPAVGYLRRLGKEGGGGKPGGDRSARMSRKMSVPNKIA